MDRNEFLKKLGLSGIALTTVYFSGCRQNSVVPASPAADFTLDLSSPENEVLNSNGGYVISNGVVVARTMSGHFSAVTRICSHEGSPSVIYIKTANEFYCPSHGASYNTNGNGLNTNGKHGLKTYRTELNGTNLRVFG